MLCIKGEFGKSDADAIKFKGQRFQCSCLCVQFHPGKKTLEVTTDPCVFGTVELLSMITNPTVSSGWFPAES